MIKSIRPAFTLLELLVVIAVIGILMAILMPAVQSVRAAAQQKNCANRIKQLAIATHHFHDTQKRFPPGVSVGHFRQVYGRNAFHAIMPFIELNQLTNRQTQNLWQVEIPDFQCPSSASIVSQDGGEPGSATDYAFCKGVSARLCIDNPQGQGIFDVNSKSAMFTILDGTSHTMMIGEAASDPSLEAVSPDGEPGLVMGQVWSKTAFDGTNVAGHKGGRGSVLAVTSQDFEGTILTPLNQRPVFVSIDVDPAIDCDQQDRVRGFLSLHRSPGANFAFADGSIHFITEYIDDTVYRRLSTMNGGKYATIPNR